MSKLLFLLTFVVSYVLVPQCESAKILAVFPFPSISHQVVFRPLTQALAKRGHEVTVITTDAAFPKGQTPPNLTEIDLHDISYEAWRKTVAKAVTGSSDIVTQVKQLSVAFVQILESQFRSTEVQTLLNETRHFDLVFTEACVRSALVYGHIYKAPVIQISSLGTLPFNNDVMGMPSHPILYPTYMRQRIHNLTAWEKVTALHTHFQLTTFFDGPEMRVEEAMLQKVFGENVPSIREFENSVDMLFLNLHPLWGGNTPVPPSVVHIWGIHKRIKKELPEDIKSYLDSSKNGVIYMSFGTNNFPSTLPTEKIQAFVKVFSELPYDVLWKWDKDELPRRTNNIKIGKWFPQSDLLRHPKVKLFVTQGGLQSTEEAINAGVPLVGVPMLGDQWYNVEKYQHFKIGKKLDMETLTVEDVRNAIHEVLTDESYRQNIVKLRSLMSDEPEPALERAVWWTEHVLRHKGAGHLRAPAANLSWTEYYEIPLVCTLLIGVVIISLFVLLTVRYFVTSFLATIPKIKQN